MPRRLGAVALLVAAVLCFTGQAVSAGQTVTISGRAYAFNHMDTFLAGATIRVREFPNLTATTDANGDYFLKVPDDANVTPYIEPPPGYHQIDLQTFHTRGEPIVNANFQTPGDAEYNGLAALLNVPLGPDGRPTECVVVSTASKRDVRGVDYETFEQRTPHGVEAETGVTAPFATRPIYFNSDVVPDRSRTGTSSDGGVIWTEMPAGPYRVAAFGPNGRFASFLATCEPGRIVNASPPWGLYELSEGEHALAAGQAVAKVESVKVDSSDHRRVIRLRLDAAEPLKLKLHIDSGDHAFVVRRAAHVGPDLPARVHFTVPGEVPGGPVRLEMRMAQALAGQAFYRDVVRLPAP